MDANSQSVVQTETAPGSPKGSPKVTPKRRISIFERHEIMTGLSPTVIGAIQCELIELQNDFEKKLRDHEERHERRITDLLRLACAERLDLEKMRLDHQSGQQGSWEEGTEGSSKASR